MAGLDDRQMSRAIDLSVSAAQTYSPDRRARRRRRPAHGRARRHRRHDRLVLLPALRLAERLRGDPRPAARRALPDRSCNARGDDQAALLPGHERPHHALPHAGRCRRGAGLHAGRAQRLDAPAADPARALRARHHALQGRGRAALRLRPRAARDESARERDRLPLHRSHAGTHVDGWAERHRRRRARRVHARAERDRHVRARDRYRDVCAASAERSGDA